MATINREKGLERENRLEDRREEKRQYPAHTSFHNYDYQQRASVSAYDMLGGDQNSIHQAKASDTPIVKRPSRSLVEHNSAYNGSVYENLSFDALFGSHYDSEKDEDYDENEDMIQNTKTYYNDRKPINFNISKAEVQYLLHEQKVDTLLFGDRD